MRQRTSLITCPARQRDTSPTRMHVAHLTTARLTEHEHPQSILLHTLKLLRVRRGISHGLLELGYHLVHCLPQRWFRVRPRCREVPYRPMPRTSMDGLARQ
jgi:hypothetical protein